MYICIICWYYVAFDIGAIYALMQVIHLAVTLTAGLTGMSHAICTLTHTQVRGIVNCDSC